MIIPLLTNIGSDHSKRVIATSSIIHMGFLLPISFLTYINQLSQTVIIMVLVSHSFISSVLFVFAGTHIFSHSKSYSLLFSAKLSLSQYKALNFFI